MSEHHIYFLWQDKMNGDILRRSQRVPPRDTVPKHSFPSGPMGIRESSYIHVLANHANRFVRRQFNKRVTCTHFRSSLLTVRSTNKLESSLLIYINSNTTLNATNYLLMNSFGLITSQLGHGSSKHWLPFWSSRNITRLHKIAIKRFTWGFSRHVD